MPVLAFDVNETLVDLSSLDALFERHLGDAALRPAWFAQAIQFAFVGAITGRYVDFTTAQRSALAIVARRAGAELGDAGAEEIVGAMRALPPHPDVEDGLRRLAGAGYTVAALTNSPLAVAQAQLEPLRDRFDAVLSADDIQALKPRPEPYRMVAERFGTDPGDVRLVAAHAWDVAGALAAGCAAAFVARPGQGLPPHMEPPDVIVSDIGELADVLPARQA
jgi:2-haloacid dehalogenase